MTAKTMKAVKLKKYNPYDCDLSKYYYDPVAGQVAVDFIEGYITHVKGELGEKPFLLLDWEKEFVSNLFGWKVRGQAYGDTEKR